MSNRDLASIGKILVLAGFFSVMFGTFLFELANTGGLCSVPLQPPGSNGPGCATDYNPLVLPTIIGGALMVAGAWLFWAFKPHRWTSSVRDDYPTDELCRDNSQPSL